MRISDWSSDVCSSDLVKRDPMPDGGFVTSYAEITERKLAEEALEDSEQRIRLFANAVPTMISYVDRNECYRFVNRAYRAAYVPDGGPILGQTLRAILGPTEYAQRRTYIDQALSGDRKSTRLNSSHYCASRMPS